MSVRLFLSFFLLMLASTVVGAIPRSLSATETALLEQQNGQEIDRLLEELTDDNTDKRREAAYALRARGAKTPEVIKALAAALDDRDDQVQFQALLALGRAGAHALPAASELIDCLDDRSDQVRYRAAVALGNIGPQVLPALRESWNDFSSLERSGICHALSLLGKDAAPMRDLVVEQLSSDSERGRRFAAEAMVAMSSDADELISLAKHDDAVIRRIGISAIASLEDVSDQLRAQLLAAVEDDDPKIRETAIIALARSSIPGEQKVKFVSQLLTDEVESVRWAAMTAITKAGLNNAGFANALATRISDAGREDSLALVRAIGQIGPAAQGTVAAVLDAADRHQLPVEEVAQVLGGLGVQVVPQLLEELQTAPETLPYVSLALAQLGEPAVESLLAGLEHENEIVRFAAAQAIGRLPSPKRPWLEALAKKLVDPAPQMRAVALEALGAAGPAAEFAVDQLVEMGSDDDPEIRAALITALASIGARGGSSTEIWRTLVRDSDESVRLQAVDATNQLVDLNSAEQDLTALLARASDESESVRAACANALEGLKSANWRGEANDALQTLLADMSVRVRVAATETFQAIEKPEKALVTLLGQNLIGDVELLRVTLAAIESAGPAAKEHRKPVMHLLDHSEANIRSSAIKALAALKLPSKEVVQPLTAKLDDGDWDVRRTAAAELAKRGKDAKVAVPRLFQMLTSDEDTDFASGALREIDAAPVEAIPLFIENLQSENRRTSFYAISLLGEIGPPAKEALPKLEALLETNDGSRGAEFRNRFLREAIKKIRSDSD